MLFESVILRHLFGGECLLVEFGIVAGRTSAEKLVAENLEFERVRRVLVFVDVSERVDGRLHGYQYSVKFVRGSDTALLPDGRACVLSAIRGTLKLILSLRF